MTEEFNSQFNPQPQFSDFDKHDHDGTNTPKINPKNLLGFPVISAVPTDAAPNGTIRFYYSGISYRLYVRINNSWKYAALT
jgi:hypothetical protein